MKIKHMDCKYLDTMISQFPEGDGEENVLPDFGGAAAIYGLIAIEMMITDYNSKTFASQYQEVDYSLAEIKELLEEDYKPKLIEYCRRDRLMFEQRNQLYSSRDQTSDKKKKDKLEKDVLENLTTAIRIPVEVCRTCISLLNIALAIYHDGFKSVHGDTGVVLSNLHLAIADSYNALLLNLKTSPSGKEMEDMNVEAVQLWHEYQGIRLNTLRRVIDICQNQGS